MNSTNPIPGSNLFRPILKAILVLVGIIVLFSMYYRSFPSPRCHPPPRPMSKHANATLIAEKPTRTDDDDDKPVVLLWFWPGNKKFDFELCADLNIHGCKLTDDRDVYSTANATLIFHNDIKDDLSNLPTAPRPKFQRWIWYNMDPPTRTRKIPGLENLFNLTLNYRRDADITAHWKLTFKKKIDDEFKVPKKELLVCWIVNTKDLKTKKEERFTFYKELIKHIKVNIFDSSSDKYSKGENYFNTISKCKFFLSFEDSIHTDYITTKLNGPLAAGTVPVVLGPPRKNYENFLPSAAFIHVNDFPDALSLVKHLLLLDDDNVAYKKYFEWRRFFNVRPHFNEDNEEFAHPICLACRHIGYSNEYRVVSNLYKWYVM